MNREKLIWCFLCSLMVFSTKNVFAQKISTTDKPNIVIIYLDDLGYGDIGCYGAKGVQTPNVDALAKNGLRFTDAHCTAATCTPSRFSLLTGMYAFRNNAAILPGDAPLLIKPHSQTLPRLLKSAGYTTAVVGKWHLGLGIGSIDWNKKVSPGPLEVGFDYSFIIPATTDRVPCVYVENHNVYNLDANDPIAVSYKGKIGDEPTGLERPDLLKMKADSQHSSTIINGISRIGFMKGGLKARWRDEDMAITFTEKAQHFIQASKGQPFFLYFSLANIHVPRTPHERFVGKSNMGRRGDMIAELDWATGAIMKTLKEEGLDKNTIVIFSSDNGPVLDDGYDDEAERLVGAHQPAGPYRGGKYSAFEGGTRVPLIVHWPARVKAGLSKALFSQIDVAASLAKLAGVPLPGDVLPDSENALPVLLGQSKVGRTVMLEESFTFSLRKGDWKYIAPQEKPTPDWLKNKKIEIGLSTQIQLYRLSVDKTESKNLAESCPEMVKELQEELQRIRQANGTRKNFKIE